MPLKPNDIINARPMMLKSEFTSDVDIIIPFHGQYDKLVRLLESIGVYTRSNYYRVTVIDDHSPNEAFFEQMKKNYNKNASRLRAESNFQAIRLPEQVGFGGACLAGYAATKNPYVCFVNSDCVIEDPMWLRGMGECLLSLKDQGVRFVTPTTNNPVDGHPEQKAATKNEKCNDHFIVPAGEYLSLYCFMCHRDLFNHCGGFLKPYPYGYFEDQEFAHRLTKHRFKQAVCKNAWIYHEGGATIRDLLRDQPNLQKVMEEDNRKRCINDMKKVR